MLHVHQRLLPRHAVPQLPEPVRLVESELSVLLLADAVDDGHDEHLRMADTRGAGIVPRTAWSNELDGYDESTPVATDG